MSDEFWYQPKRPKSDIAAEHLARLNFVPTTEAAPAPALPPVTEEERRAFYERQDRLFANGYVRIVGTPYPVSKTLAKQLGFDVERLLPPFPSYDVGNDDGEG